MNEIDFEIENEVLIIKVPIGAGFDRPSASGKSQLVASTGGFKGVDGTDVRVNLSIIRNKEEKQAKE